VKRCYFVFFIAFCTSCTYFRSQPVSQVESQTIPVSFDPDLVKSVSLHTQALVDQFYRERNFVFAWSDSTGRMAVADSLISFIRSCEEHGLIPGDYHFHEIEKVTSIPLSHANAAALDFYLSDAYFTLWHHLKQGRVDPKTFARTDLSASKVADALASLSRALNKINLREELELQIPRDNAYRDFQQTLKASLQKNQNDSLFIKQREKLIVNLERLRWKKKRPDSYILVNTPSFKLMVVDKDSVILETKVIVGKPETPTPELNSMIRSFIIYPYWHVPKSIVKEILPHIQEDTLYLKRHNYDVLNSMGLPVKASAVAWQEYDAETFPYILRQREGSENTMGVIKFIFHNNYGVYLHDTNARRLFSKTDRALSHGCIRVHKAVALARYLIREDYIVSPEDLDQYMQLQHRMEVRLPKPIALYLDYFTCESVNGEIHYYEDIYRKDELVLRALSGEEPPARNDPSL
jgi:murein L,D-transpeptidase YcbB/YkuD